MTQGSDSITCTKILLVPMDINKRICLIILQDSLMVCQIWRHLKAYASMHKMWFPMIFIGVIPWHELPFNNLEGIYQLAQSGSSPRTHLEFNYYSISKLLLPCSTKMYPLLIENAIFTEILT